MSEMIANKQQRRQNIYHGAFQFPYGVFYVREALQLKSTESQNLPIINTHCMLLSRTHSQSGLIFVEWRGRSG